MAKYNNKNANANKQQDNRPKPIFKTLPLVVTGRDAKGNEYDVESCKEIMATLANADVFAKLNVGAMAARSLVSNDADAKGTMTVAAIEKYDAETENVELVFAGKNLEVAGLIDDTMVIVPRVRSNHKTGIVSKIFGFEIVPAMEA